MAVLPTAVLRPITVNAFESTVEQLASAIRLGVFVQGDQLPPERELAETLGVSRNTLREAMATLRDLALVQTRRGRGGGTVVTYDGDPPGTSPLPAGLGEEFADALDFRRVVEPGAAALAARRALTGAQRAFLSDALTAVVNAPENGARRIADSRLHLAVVTLTGSPMLIEAVTRVQATLDQLLRRIPVLPTNIKHSDDQHRDVVAAILAGHADAARAAMEEHVDGTAALLRGLIGVSEPPRSGT
jgi:GntR family transcriptional repressor for pyruvate dehydrogenase complex